MVTIEEYLSDSGAPQGTNWDEDSRVRWSLRKEGLEHLEVDEARVLLRPSTYYLESRIRELGFEILKLSEEKIYDKCFEGCNCRDCREYQD